MTISSGNRVGRVVKIGDGYVDIAAEPWREIEADCLAAGVRKFGPAYYDIHPETGRPILWVHWLYKLGQMIGWFRERSVTRLQTGKVPERIVEMVTTGLDEHGLRLHKTPGHLEAEDRLNQGQRMLLFVGVPGTGKSTAAAWMIFDRMVDPFRCGVIVRWVHALALHRLSDWGKEDKRTLARLKAIPWLVIDDLGEEDDRKSGKISELLAARYDNNTITICTTNLRPVQVAGADGYGPRIVTRFKEIGGFVVFRDVVRYEQEPKKETI
jgi:hypothetical protein